MTEEPAPGGGTDPDGSGGTNPGERRANGRDDVPWYEDHRGDVLVTVLAVVTGVGVALSMGWGRTLVIVPPLRVTVPIDIYLYGFLGAITRAIATFVTDLEQVPGIGTSTTAEGRSAERSASESDVSPGEPTSASVEPTDDEGVVEGLSSMEVKRMALRVFAGLCLAVGLFLTSDLVVQTFRYVEQPADPLMAGLAFIAGFYVDEAYAVLGSLADRALEPLSEAVAEPDGPPVVGNPLSTGSDEDIGDRPWFLSVRVWILVGVGVVLTTVAVLLSIEWGGPDAPHPSFLPLPPAAFPANRVPFDVYLYAFLGSMGYVFTSLFHEYDRTLRSFVQHALRAPVGPLLAAALFLLSTLVLGSTSTRVAQFHAGVAFLVGLYTNVALLTFDAIAARLFGAIADESDGPDEEHRRGGRSE